MDQSITQVIGKLKEVFPEARFIIFGSQATGKTHEESDLDLCAIFPSLSKDPFDLVYEIRVEAQKYLEIGMDIFVISENAYSERSLELGSLEYIIASEGISVS